MDYYKPSERKALVVRSDGLAMLEAVPDEILLMLMDLIILPKDLANFFRVSKRVLSVASKYFVWIRRELICYFSKKSFVEDVMGVGIHVERHKSNQGLFVCLCLQSKDFDFSPLLLIFFLAELSITIAFACQLGINLSIIGCHCS